LLNLRPKTAVISGIKSETNEKEHVKHFSRWRGGACVGVLDFRNPALFIQPFPNMKTKTTDQLFAYLVSAIIGLMMFAVASPAIH